jgi:hypothetical protein
VQLTKYLQAVKMKDRSVTARPGDHDWPDMEKYLEQLMQRKLLDEEKPQLVELSKEGELAAGWQVDPVHCRTANQLNDLSKPSAPHQHALNCTTHTCKACMRAANELGCQH